MAKNNLCLKVIKVPPATTKADIRIDLDTEQVFIYRIEVVGNHAYIFYDNRSYRSVK